jgi:hypothetical protein
MDKIKQLKLKKAFKEFEYLQSECEYRQELISEIDVDFIKSVNEFLVKFPDLKELYEKKTQQKIDIIFDQIKKKQELSETEEISVIDEQIDEVLEEEEKAPVDGRLKILYRAIVKLTHPDKINDKRLNELYIQATKYYEKLDIHNLYRICDQLNIQYEMEETEIEKLESKIVELKDKVTFTESTYTWKWYHSPTDALKNSLIVEFIRRQIS